ncbi:MAG TPA: TolC family protein, partial [Limnobacter sp.]|nr:TolC family protein [Limnobacter sp.]
MSPGFKDIQIDTYEAYLERATQANPSYIAATQALKISELNVLSARGGVAPTVGLSAVASERNGRRTDNVGVSVNIPLGVQNYLGVSVAKDRHRAQTETYRGIEQNLRLMIQQLQSQSASGRIEVAVRTDAISSAELSVQANQKSYLGGVRTQIEVLNSIQTLFDTQVQQINARLTLAQNVLKLELESGAEPVDALLKVQSLLF